MWNRLFITALLAAALAWAATGTVACAAEDVEDDDEGGEVRLKLDQVPEAVRKALLKEAGGAKFDTVEREVEGGRTVYEIEVVIDGKTWGIEVDENGKLLEKELEDAEDEDADEAGGDDEDAKPAGKAAAAKEGADDGDAEDDDAEDDDAEEDEQQVTLDQLPAAVKKALTKEAGDGKIGEIEKETEGGRTVYEAEVTTGGKTWEITFGVDGKVIKKELDDDEAEGEGDDD